MSKLSKIDKTSMKANTAIAFSDGAVREMRVAAGVEDDGEDGARAVRWMREEAKAEMGAEAKVGKLC